MTSGARAFCAALAALVVCLVAAPAGSAATPPTGFQESSFGNGLTSPVAAAKAPDGRTFVAEKPGRVRVVDPAGGLKAAPVLDITAKVNSHHDRGLLGLAVDKDFATNGYLYLLYTVDVDQLVRDSAKPMTARLSRVKVGADNSVSAETTLIGSYDAGPCPAASNDLDCIPSNGLSHSIGTVRVDPDDGTLWVGVGDSSSYTSVDELAFRTYDERSYAGKLLHVDRDGRGLPNHPYCPTNANYSQVCTKLHAKGFRNPFRFHLRRGKDPIAGDVGWDAREEVDIVRAGRNYGWPCWEGPGQTPGYRDDQRCRNLYTAGGDAKPLYSYPHFDSAGTSAAVVGGPQMSDTSWPEAQRGSIYFGDYAKGFLKRIKLDSSDNCVDRDSAGACVAQPFADGWYGGVDLQAEDGDSLLYVEFGDGGPNGSLKRIDYTAGNKSPIAKASASPRYGAAPLDVQLSSAGSSDPEGQPLTYRWDFGDGSAPSTTANPRHTYVTKGTYTARLTVSDGDRSATSEVVVTPGNQPPTANIASPADLSRYRAGQTINLSGAGQDPDDGTLSGESLQWRVTLVHNSHDHPLATMTGSNASFTAADDHDADSYYRVTLRAVDSNGLDTERTVTLRPETVNFSIQSEPESGAPVSYGGTDAATPYSRSSAVGYKTSVSAAETFSKLGKYYMFDRWSDGGARNHVLTIPSTDSTLTASYREDKAAARPATASSTARAGLEPAKANDVNSGTRWSSSYADNQWWQVDLGTTRKVDTVELNWEAAYARSYKILTSTDGVNFTERASDGATASGSRKTTFGAVDARYVRVLGVTRATGYGFSFWDARVTGPSDTAPTATEDKALNRSTSASSNYSTTLTPEKANDGNSATRWSSAKGLDNQWWQVDLGKTRKVDAVELNWEAAYASRYRIATSTDGTNFTDAATVDINTTGFKRTTFAARDARYVRVIGVTRATAYGISFWDARVFGPDDATTTPPPPPPPPEDKALRRPASSSTNYDTLLTPEKANDGDSQTRWSSAKGLNNQWWTVDLGRSRKVDAVEVNWEAAYASQYEIQTSLDGTNFTRRATESLSAKALKRTSFPSVDARYVRVLGLTRGTTYGFSFWDARVFGAAD